MDKPEEELHGKQATPGDVADAGFGLATALGLAVWVFTRTGMGTHALVPYGPLVLVSLIVYAGVTRSNAVLCYAALWAVAASLRGWAADRTQHSKYLGHPWLGWELSPVKRDWAAGPVEAFSTVLAGVLVAPLSEALALLLLASGVGMTVHMLTVAVTRAAMTRNARDAAIQQTQFAEDFNRNF